MADSQPDDQRPVAPRRSLSKSQETAGTAASTEQGRAVRRPRAQSASAATATRPESGAGTGSTEPASAPRATPGTSDNGVAATPAPPAATMPAAPSGPAGSPPPAVATPGQSAAPTSPARPRWSAPGSDAGASPLTSPPRPAGSQIRTAAEIAGRTAVAPPGATPPTAARPARKATEAAPSPVTRGKVRRARLRLSRVDPWSVMKTAFLLSIAFGIVCIVAVFIVYSVLGAAGVWDSINKAVNDVLNSSAPDSFDVNDYVGAGRVMGFTILVACVDVVLITAIATLGAFMYNLSASLLGGIEITLAED
jgi:hypothetical protein